MYLTETFARLVTGTRYEDISAEARSKAKECILDCIGVGRRPDEVNKSRLKRYLFDS